MMHHLDEGTLQSLLDGELPPAAVAETRTHLAACEDCNTAYEHVRAASLTLASAISLLDGRAAGARKLRPAPGRSSGRRERWGGSALPRAAALLLTFAAAASATIPGSPVRGWLAGRAEPAATPATAEVGRSEAVAVATATEVPVEAGVSVEPLAGRFRVVLTDASPDLRIRARFTDSSRGGVFATGEAAGASFRTGAGVIEVVGAAGGELRVEVPRRVAAATLEVDGILYLVKEGEHLRLAVPAESSTAAEILFRVQP
jgi:hypothetical protein